MVRNKHYRIFVDPVALLGAGVTWEQFISNPANVPFTLGLFDVSTNTSIDPATLTAATFPQDGVYFGFKLDAAFNPDVPFVKSPNIIFPNRIKNANKSVGVTGQNQQFVVYGAKASQLNAFCLKLSIYPDDIWLTYNVKPVTKTWCGTDACIAAGCDPCQTVECYKGMFELWKAFQLEEPNTEVHVSIGTYDPATSTFTVGGAPGADPVTVWSWIETQVAANPNFCPALLIDLDPYNFTTKWCQVFEYPLNPYYLAILSGHWALNTSCGAQIVELQQHSRSRNTGWEVAFLELGDAQHFGEIYTIEAITGFINPYIKQRADISAIYDVYSVVYNPLDAGYSDVTLYVATKQPAPAFAGALDNVFNVFAALGRGEFANAK
ncbi:MAG: hypothetical protein KatS3mg083_523 [Candidatus Dojkabacteria bacterium]|nr:MAG: hypothetical protein KatS3mg083_523 [Candidatus Dojkabacteria bacterium]